jgi:hypothetical protein
MAPKVLEFKSKGPKRDSKDGDIVDHGQLGDLDYEVYSRGVIHIFDKNDHMFHKGIDTFEEEIAKNNFSKMSDGESFLVKGSGDTDNLIFLSKEGEIRIELSKKGFDVLEKLKGILRRNKQ